MTTNRAEPALIPGSILAARRWRQLHTPPLSGAANMGLDEALMARARETGVCTFRVYSWSTPTLSLGRNQLARGRIDPERLRRSGVDVVRRPTGGRALLHHRELTYSVAAPIGRDESAKAWYAAINAVLLEALGALGVPAVPATIVGRTPTPGTASCFQRPDVGEIVVDGRKLVGSAVLKERGALLQHGSILLDDDQGMLVDLLPAGESPPEPAATLRASLGSEPPLIDTVADALFDALGRHARAERAPLDVDDGLRREAALAAQRYASDEWTFRC
jgi:lipoate-protein ligase A